jgi:hypothetical protein
VCAKIQKAASAPSAAKFSGLRAGPGAQAGGCEIGETALRGITLRQLRRAYLVAMRPSALSRRTDGGRATLPRLEPSSPPKRSPYMTWCPTS